MKAAGPVALVVGGGDELHRAVGRRLAREGSHVVVACGDSARARQVCAAVDQIAPGRSTAERLGPSSTADTEALVERLGEEFGGLDVFVAIAEEGDQADQTSDNGTPILAGVVDSIAAPLYALTRPIVTGMTASGGGRILNLCRSPSLSNDEPVVAMRWATLAGFTRSLALEAGRRGITVNLLTYAHVGQQGGRHGGGGDRPVERRTALRSRGRVDDVAAVAAFLVSDDASYVTGQVVSACGGSSIGRIPL